MAEHPTTENSSEDSTGAHAMTNPLGAVDTQKITSLGQTAIQASPKNSSASSYGAAVKVFSINELVAMILEQVPVESRPSMRRVSKTWCSTISEIGYTVKPVIIDYINTALGYPFQQGPRYEVGFTIRMNPAISSSLYPLFGFPHARFAFEDGSDQSKLLAKRQEFITSPPITMIMLALRDPNPNGLQFNDHKSHAILRNSTGVCIGDLLDTFDQVSMHGSPVLKKNAAPSGDPHKQPVAFFNVRGLQVEMFLEE